MTIQSYQNAIYQHSFIVVSELQSDMMGIKNNMYNKKVYTFFCLSVYLQKAEAIIDGVRKHTICLASKAFTLDKKKCFVPNYSQTNGSKLHIYHQLSRRLGSYV